MTNQRGKADCGAPLRWDEVAVCSIHGLNCPPTRADTAALREAAKRVLDDWNHIGAQGDGYRALRAALNDPAPALDVAALAQALARLDFRGWGEPFRGAPEEHTAMAAAAIAAAYAAIKGATDDRLREAALDVEALRAAVLALPPQVGAEAMRDAVLELLEDMGDGQDRHHPRRAGGGAMTRP